MSKGGGGAGLGNVTDQMMADVGGDGAVFRHIQTPRTCSIVGAPMTYGQPYAGTDSGPTLLREAGLREMLSSLGWRVEDLPDLEFEDATAHAAVPGAKNAALVCRGAQQVYEMVQQKLRERSFPLILGGDHSIGIGSLAALLSVYPNAGVLWIDAHADLNTPALSTSGNMHGMPVGLHMQGMQPPVNHASIPGFEWWSSEFPPQLPPSSLVYVGLRDVDAAERKLIRQLGIRAYTMHEVDRYGIGKVMEMAQDHLLVDDPHRKLHLSYDIDAIDPVLAPATGTTVRGGLNYREAHYVAESVASTGNLVSAEIVELNPTLSPAGGARDTVELGLQIITSFMGKTIL